MTRIRLSALNLFAILLSAAIFIACSKEENTTSSSVDKIQNSKIETNSQTARLFENIDPVQVGILHNKYLTQAVQIKELNPNLSFKEAYMQVKIDNVTPTFQSAIFDKVNETSSDEMKSVVISKLSSQKAVDFYNSVEMAVDNSADYQTLNSNLNVIKNNVIKNLSGNDLDYVLVQLETIRASAYFWTPKELGGSGSGNNYMQNNSMKADSTIKKDGRGAGYGMVCWSFSAFLGPVGAAGLIYGAVSGALVSSFLP